MKKLLLILFAVTAFGANAQNLDSVTIYPNPYSTQVCLEFDLLTDDTVTWQLFDRFGRVKYTPYDHEFLTSGHHSRCLQNDSLRDGIYYHRVSASSGFAKNQIVHKISGGSSIEERFIAPGLNFFPNPVSSNLYLKEAADKLIIYSLTGQLIMESNRPNREIDLSSLPRGVYQLILEKDKKRSHHKLVKD